MGEISLDPASNEFANQVVKAKRFFTVDDNGLTQPWIAGSVFLNPPYGKTFGRSNQEVWSERMVAEYNAGHFYEGIMLVNAVTDRKWFQKLWVYPICFTDHRIRFYSPQGAGNAPTHGNAFVYLGNHHENFMGIFSQFGVVVTAL
jgi:hypothetical protein